MPVAQLPPTQIGYRPEEAGKVLGVSRNTVYTYLRSGTLRAKKLGASTIIPADELRRFLDDAPYYAPKPHR